MITKISPSIVKKMGRIMDLVSKNGHYVLKKKSKKDDAMHLLYTFKIIDYSWYGKNKKTTYAIVQGNNFTEAYCLGPKKFIHNEERKHKPHVVRKLADSINPYQFTLIIVYEFIWLIIDFFVQMQKNNFVLSTIKPFATFIVKALNLS